MFYDLADTAEVMRWYRDLLPSLPEELSGWMALLTIPPAPSFPAELHGRKACCIVWCYTGPHGRADEVLAPVATFGMPLLNGIHPMPFTALQSAFDPLIPAGLQGYWKADFFTEISDTAIDVHLEHGALMPAGLSACTCTRSTAQPAGSPRTRPRSPTGTGTRLASSSAWTPTRPTPG